MGKNKETVILAICKSCKIMEVESLTKDTMEWIIAQWHFACKPYSLHATQIFYYAEKLTESLAESECYVLQEIFILMP